MLSCPRGDHVVHNVVGINFTSKPLDRLDMDTVAIARTDYAVLCKVTSSGVTANLYMSAKMLLENGWLTL